MTVPTPESSDRYYGDYYEDAPPVSALSRPPRRRHRGRGWLIALLVLVALLIGADRIAAAVTESQLAAKIQSSQNLSRKPSVSIDGFPFLTQVISRHFGNATVDIDNLDERGVPIAHIHADLNGVHVSSGYNSATVDTLTGTATLSYAQLSTTLSKDAGIGQITLSQGAGNQVKAAYNLAGIGISADVAVSVLSGNRLEFKTTHVQSPLSGLGLKTPANFDVKVPLGNLPFGMQLQDLRVTPTGVDISATGHNVLLTGSSVGTTG
ncbi:DUF2993 domain-containing protein [Actinocrinis puniceicyclus]|uniref:DUF2993 domain-containing protein n=1 Tax=Actinocrinis puniceicyclus TaxID=977794 RepID=A0A8J7WMB1_9ACTN|nr:DUF2993 domain-containing protein [Actinocrinis puniceicyclus]MBS2962297.1 DUF2993 domain-containing protein [Actinocrinis puniceicyclus]